MRSAKHPVLACVLIVLISVLVISCGKKGPPTLEGFEKPGPVTDIRVVHRDGELVISWSYPGPARETIKGFYIEKAAAPEQDTGNKAPEFRNLGFLGSNASGFIDRDFKVGGKYLYKMRAYSLRNVLGLESKVIHADPSEPPPPPAGLSYKAINDSVEITWERVPGNVRYNVYKSYEAGKYPAAPLNKPPLQEPSFRDKVETERVSYYTVKSQLAAGLKDEGRASPELMVDPGTFVPASPTHLKFVLSGKKVYLMWNESPETWAGGYRVYRKRAQEAEFRNIGETIAPAFTDNGPLASKTFYSVTALGPKEESAPSEVIEVQPLVER